MVFWRNFNSFQSIAMNLVLVQNATWANHPWYMGPEDLVKYFCIPFGRTPDHSMLFATLDKQFHVGFGIWFRRAWIMHVLVLIAQTTFHQVCGVTRRNWTYRKSLINSGNRCLIDYYLLGSRKKIPKKFNWSRKPFYTFVNIMVKCKFFFFCEQNGATVHSISSSWVYMLYLLRAKKKIASTHIGAQRRLVRGVVREGVGAYCSFDQATGVCVPHRISRRFRSNSLVWDWRVDAPKRELYR